MIGVNKVTIEQYVEKQEVKERQVKQLGSDRLNGKLHLNLP